MSTEEGSHNIMRGSRKKSNAQRFDDSEVRARPYKKESAMNRLQETEHGGFRCSHCKEWAIINETIGTENRNHCPTCLWSKHLDDQKPGDRKSTCKSGMEPIGLTFKKEGQDKYGEERQGEIMLIHQCSGCDKLSINRIAADDSAPKILDLLETPSHMFHEDLHRLEEEGITPLTPQDLQRVSIQLFGKPNMEVRE